MSNLALRGREVQDWGLYARLAGMIIGTGIDIIEVRRLERLLERHGERALRRIFTESERAYCLGLSRPAPSLAARFAAKEALYKALGTGIGAGGAWVEAEVVRCEDGRPTMRLHGTAAESAARLRVRRIHLSLSHTDELATASVILEG